MPPIHRHNDARSCGATTTVTGQSTVYSNSELVNSSIKILYPIGKAGFITNSMLAINVGFGLSNNYDKWIFRPELGLLTNFSLQGAVPVFSLGLSIYP